MSQEEEEEEVPMNQAAVRFNFEYGDENQDVETILALKQLNIQIPWQFRINTTMWNEELLAIFLDVFHHFAERGVKWKWLTIDLETIPDLYLRYVRPLLFTANALSLFENICIDFDNDNDEEQDPDSEYTLPGISLNRRLNNLQLFLPMGYHMSAADSRALRNCLQTTSTLTSLHLSVPHFDLSLLCEGFEGNRTLRFVDLPLFVNPIPDAEISRVISSLHGHPTLEYFAIRGGQVGNNSLEAIQTLLTTSSSLSYLELEKTDYEEGDLQIDYLVEGLKQSSSLEVLSISGFPFQDEFPFLKLFNVLRHCPTLQILNLGSIRPLSDKKCHLGFPSMEDFDKVTSIKRLPGPVEMSTRCGWTFHSEMFPSLGKLFRAHPEIRFPPFLIWSRSHNMPPEDIKHVAYMNYYGRYLLDRPKNTPLSLWPLVFERANDNASVMYEFLKGPAFAGRQNFI